MAHYKNYNRDQNKFLPINFSEQILPGSFEYTLNYVIDNELDLSVFESRYKNDDGGSPAYDPAILLKIVLAAYSRGFTSSRAIEHLCRENITFMALSADSQPHFTTIAHFISQMSDVIQPLFLQVLMVCDDTGLIGDAMFAIDGCKLPSNASKEWSGTHAELAKKQQKIDCAVRRMLKKHREEDAAQTAEPGIRQREQQHINKIRAVSRKIKKHLATTEERIGSRGKTVKSNITDNESARMTKWSGAILNSRRLARRESPRDGANNTSHGTLQGYVGVAAVDSKRQIVISAEAFGQGQEHDLLEPLVEGVKNNIGDAYIEQAKLTADSGFHNKSNVTYCQQANIDAYIADKAFRSRDPRFKDYKRFKPKAKRARNYYTPVDFSFDAASGDCHCPAGKALWRSQSGIIMGDYIYDRYEGYLNDCRQCSLRKRCMRKPPTNRGRQVSIRRGTNENPEPNLLKHMQEKIDSDRGRHIYSQRIGTVEPVFGNINTNKRLNRFSHRSKRKVNAQWLMYCMVHNIEKIQHYGNIDKKTKH